MKNEKIRVVIADDNAMLRSRIRNFLEKSPNIIVVGEAGNGQEVLDQVETHKPDILILDIQMPILDGLAAMRMLRHTGSRVTVIVLSGLDDPYYIAESKTYGAFGYILKEDAPAQIMSAVYDAARGANRHIHPLSAERSHSH